MGVRANETGVTLKFFNADGTADETRDDVTGEFAFFFSKHRHEAPGNTDPSHGSPDWLTDIIVVDNPSKLNNITATQTGIQLTSGASKNVLVRWDVGSSKGTLVDCYTIVSKFHPANGLVFAETIEVVHPDPITMDPIQMDSSNALIADWTNAAKLLLTQVASPTSAQPSQSAGPGTTSSKKP